MRAVDEMEKVVSMGALGVLSAMLAGVARGSQAEWIQEWLSLSNGISGGPTMRPMPAIT